MSLPALNTYKAPLIWKYLNGLFVIYKPAGITFNRIRQTILHNLSRDLNDLDVRAPMKRVEIEKLNDDQYGVQLVPDMADTIQATGPRYQMKDFRLISSVNLGRFTSGVMLLGVHEDGLKKARFIRYNMSMRVFHATGKLGSQTENNMNDTRVVERAEYGHVYEDKLTNMVQSIQASHQRKMFEICGVDIQSQAAYDLAVKGLLRPATTETPVIYNIKCLEFKRPYFTLEICSINENEAYLAKLIQDIGLTLRTYAHCTKLRCVRHGVFTLDDAMLRERWNLQSIISNMAFCNVKLKENPDMLRQSSPTLVPV